MPRKKGGALKGDDVNKFVKASYEDRKGKTERIGDYELDKSLSNATTKVYHDPKTNKVVVANRGTKSTSIRDWTNNAFYAVGLYDKTGRYKQAEDTQRKAIEKYGKDSITNIGHSQGAIITRNLKDKNLTNQLINVNPASKGEKVRKGETVIKSSGDVVSALVPTGKNIKVIPAKTYNPLTEHSSDILEGDQTIYGTGLMGGCHCGGSMPRRYL
jgi:tetratricopeptide (TPR) repeat protein